MTDWLGGLAGWLVGGPPGLFDWRCLSSTQALPLLACDTGQGGEDGITMPSRRHSGCCEVVAKRPSRCRYVTVPLLARKGLAHERRLGLVSIGRIASRIG